MAAPLDPHLQRLHEWFGGAESVLVAYSGGTDSALVLRVAHDVLGSRAVALTAVSPSLSPEERAEAVRVAREIGAHHVLVDSHEIDDPAYAANPTNRCYHCKSELYRLTEPERLRLDLRLTVNGTNVDDLGDVRPGLEAAREAGVRSPLVEAGMRKQDVRRVARDLGLSIWDKPAAACLASRIPHGTAVTLDRLAQIGRFEAALKALGFRQVRVRYHGDTARIETATVELARAVELRHAIVAAGKAAGFTFVALDLEGYRMGSFNERLPLLPTRDRSAR